jgi:hypothetical protein
MNSHCFVFTWNKKRIVGISVVDPKLLIFFFGSVSGFNLNFGSGSGLFMKNTFELQII